MLTGWKTGLVALMTSSALAGVASAQAVQTAPTAQASSSDAANGAPQGEIVVTAQRRNESIQHVPISLQALTPQVLEQHQVKGFDDYVKLLPSVSFQSLGPGNSQLFFRGVTSGSDGDALSTSPTAGVYLDDMPVTTIGGLLDVHIYDMQRVEALAGPQGTLFGANSLSGTMRLITNKPNFDKFQAGYSLDANTFVHGQAGGTLDAFVNVPISPSVALRASGFYQRQGGYIDNTYVSRTYQRPHTLSDGTVATSPLTVNNSSAVKNDFNSVDTYGGRLALGIKLDDNWTITPSVIAQEQKGHGSFLTDPNAGDLNVHDFIDGQSNDKWYQAALSVHGKIANWDVVYSGGYMQRQLVLNQDYSYYTVAYDQYPDYTYFQNKNGSALNPTQFEKYIQNFTKQTHELRFSTPTGGRFDFTGGLFYQRQTDHFVTHFYVPGLANTDQAADYAVEGDDIYHSNAMRVDRDYAIFGQGDYHITSKLTLTGGLRGYKYDNTIVGFSGFASTAVAAGCVPYTESCVSLNKQAKGSGETHKVSLAWQADADKMLYATYSTGFRPGGINRRAGVAPYKKDTLDNYELGFKTTWLGRRLRVNGAIYYERWNDMQYGVLGTTGAVNFVNAGDANIYGVELDSQLRLGGLTLSASGAYNDAKLATDFCADGSYSCTTGLNAAKGTRLPVQPRFKGNMTARYDFDVSTWKPFFQVSMLHQSGATSRLSPSENALLGDTPAFSTFDLSAGFKFNGMDIQAYAKNVFDTRGQLSRNAYCTSSLCYQHYRVYNIQPLLVGVKISQAF